MKDKEQAMTCPPNPIVRKTLWKILGDGETYNRQALKEAIIGQLSLTKEQIEERIASGKSTKLMTRIGAQLQSMVEEGLIERCGKGEVRLKK